MYRCDDLSQEMQVNLMYGQSDVSDEESEWTGQPLSGGQNVRSRACARGCVRRIVGSFGVTCDNGPCTVCGRCLDHSDLFTGRPFCTSCMSSLPTETYLCCHRFHNTAVRVSQVSHPRAEYFEHCDDLVTNDAGFRSFLGMRLPRGVCRTCEPHCLKDIYQHVRKMEWKPVDYQVVDRGISNGPLS